MLKPTNWPRIQSEGYWQVPSNLPGALKKLQFIKIIKKDLGPSCERHAIFHERSLRRLRAYYTSPFINQTPLVLRLHADMSARFGSAAHTST